MEAFIKDPNATKDYTWDWTRDLGSDTISSAQIIVSPSGLNASPPTFTTTHVTTNLSGGTLNVKYRVTCRIVAGGKTFDKLITILCQDE